MATVQTNEYCKCLQNDPQKFKINMRKFHCIIFWRFEVIEESSQEEYSLWLTHIHLNV